MAKGSPGLDGSLTPCSAAGVPGTSKGDFSRHPPSEEAMWIYGYRRVSLLQHPLPGVLRMPSSAPDRSLTGWDWGLIPRAQCWLTKGPYKIVRCSWGRRKDTLWLPASMGRLGVGAGKDREATPGLEEDCQGRDGARASRGPQRTGNPTSEVGMWRGQWGGGHANLDWSKSKPAWLYRAAGWWNKAGWGPRDLRFKPRIIHPFTATLWPSHAPLPQLPHI